MVYEYKCPKCGKKIEHYLEVKDYRKPMFCECGEQLEKLVPNFRWKFGGVTSRTDIEMSVVSQEESMRQMASDD